MEAKFNLLHEPWIKVLDTSGVVREVSLLEVFREAQGFARLAGELPTQDAALLRLLLSVLYCVFTKQDVRGDDVDIDNKGDAVKRWKSLWDIGYFPYQVIERYLRQYEERFFLFHPETPFYQVAELKGRKTTDYTAAKLNGELSQSGNKIRLFAPRSGEAKQRLTYPEAARWLLYLNGYDDTSAKPSVRGADLPSTGAGYLGKLGFICALGDNLFETLMLNFELARDDAEGLAVWERAVCAEERREINKPASRKELLTIQSRRLLLVDDDESRTVRGFKLLGGDFFQTENAFVEHMTLWRKDSTNKATTVFKPQRHDPAKSIWRDFTSLTVKNDNQCLPGVVDWIAALVNNGSIAKEKQIRFQAASIKYGDKDFFVDDVFSDSISVNAALLSHVGESWISRISEVLKTTETCVWYLKNLAKEIVEASNEFCEGDKKKSAASRAASLAYFNFDIPFRRWLAGIDPNRDRQDEKTLEWLMTVREQLLAQGEQMLAETDGKALIGEKTAFDAYSKFENCVIKSTEGRGGESGQTEG